MRYILSFLLISLIACDQKVEEASTKNTVLTTFILVRHAEKQDDGSKDPDLTEAGLQRAQDLVALLKQTQVDAIYSTPFRRTVNTVLPLAQAKGLEVKTYEAMKAEAMDSLLISNLGGTIVVSGHSNTTPWVANYFLGNEAFQNFDDADYDNVLLLTIAEKGNAKVTRMTYGAETN
ncbi:MAG: phosphoglycerate mutase family protein [Cyclobacteriaceae bacterium]